MSYFFDFFFSFGPLSIRFFFSWQVGLFTSVLKINENSIFFPAIFLVVFLCFPFLIVSYWTLKPIIFLSLEKKYWSQHHLTFFTINLFFPLLSFNINFKMVLRSVFFYDHQEFFFLILAIENFHIGASQAKKIGSIQISSLVIVHKDSICDKNLIIKNGISLWNILNMLKSLQQANHSPTSILNSNLLPRPTSSFYFYFYPFSTSLT